MVLCKGHTYSTRRHFAYHGVRPVRVFCITPAQRLAGDWQRDMTHDEALRVAMIACTADGECGHCAGSLLDLLAVEFPDHVDVWSTGWERYNDEYEPPTYTYDITPIRGDAWMTVTDDPSIVVGASVRFSDAGNVVFEGRVVEREPQPDGMVKVRVEPTPMPIVVTS